MAVTALGSGSQTTVLTTEHTLQDVAAAGTYTLHLDTNVMVDGDLIEVRIYQMVLTGGTRRVAYYTLYDGAQATDDLIKISVPISNELTDSGSLRFTLKQTAGTVHAYPWKVLKYA
jgi:hypothetical protein